MIVGEGRLDATSLQGKIVAEIATRARQLGVPAHCDRRQLRAGRASTRSILDLQEILEAGRRGGDRTAASRSLAA